MVKLFFKVNVVGASPRGVITPNAARRWKGRISQHYADIRRNLADAREIRARSGEWDDFEEIFAAIIYDINLSRALIAQIRAGLRGVHG